MRHRGVIARRLALLGAEIFHRLEVQKAVDRLLVRRRIGVVHLLADRHPPFGDAEGVGDIGPDRADDDQRIAPVKQEGEDQRDQCELKDQRPDREQHETQQEIDALHAALDNAGQPAGLAGDVIAQRQRMDVLKGFQRQRPQRALRHPHEDRVAQFAKAHRHQPRQPVSHGQRDGAKAQKPGLVTGLARQTVHRRLVKEGRQHRDHLGGDQEGHRQNDALLHPAVPLGPQIGRHRAHRAPAAGPLRAVALASLRDLRGRHGPSFRSLMVRETGSEAPAVRAT